MKIPRGSRYSYPSPNNYTGTYSTRTAIHTSRQDKQTPWNREDDTRIQSKILSPGINTENQSFGNQLSSVHCQLKIDTRQLRPEMLSNTEFTMGPED